MKKERLLSLDMLRGFDLFMLVFLQPMLVVILSHFQHFEFVQYLLCLLDHEQWVGFRVWDIIMPLFLFMAGVAMPFSFSSLTKANRKEFLYKVAKRVIILWILGMIVQGNLLAFVPENFKYYSNTLQAIAAGYLITALSMIYFPGQKRMIVILIILLLAYWLPMTLFGDFTKEGNFAFYIDELVLGSHRDDFSYTWILSSFGFGATVMLGALSGCIVRRKDIKTCDVNLYNNVEAKNKLIKQDNIKKLLIVGSSLLFAGLLLSLQMPIIKRIWSTSMVLCSGGICFLMLALCYYIFDYKNMGRDMKWPLYFGMNSITAYMLGEWMNFRPLTNQFTFGLQQLTGSYYPILLALGQVIVVFLILKYMFRCNKFIKI